MAVITSSPTIEHHREPFGIAERSPRISWTVEADAHPVGYELQQRRDGVITSTGQVHSTEQVLLAWPFEPLPSRARAEVRVRVWLGAHEEPEAWSAWTSLERGLDKSDWVAAAVTAPWPEDPNRDRRPPLLRRRFTLPTEPVDRARIHVTAHGLFELELNGVRVGRDELAPGWTVYDQRQRTFTYDVTDLLQPGANVVGAWLGDGWYRGRIGFHGGHRNLWGADLALIAQLEVLHADGTRTLVATDAEWEAAYGPILLTGLYDGEHYDARLESPFSTSDADRDGWSPVHAAAAPVHTFVNPSGPPVRVIEDLHPVSIRPTRAGRHLVDYGQNFAGRVRIRVSGRAGTEIVLRHAEVLQDGEIYTRPLRDAAATDRYILRGDGIEEWEPRFTIHGFRYLEVEGWPGVPAPADLTGRVLHTDMLRTGWFHSSDPELNRLHENVLWSMRSNFVDVPTDCPQRDERLGWTGDIQVFAPTAAFLYDCSGMLDSWLQDLAVEQRKYGTVPWYVPVIPGDEWSPPSPAAVWGDAATLTPWTLYERFGDLGLLRQQYPSAKAWVDQVEMLAGPSRIWDSGKQLGDWLDPAAPPEDPADATTDRYLVATAYFAWSALHLARSAEALGLIDDADTYHRLAAEVRGAFRQQYRTPDGLLTSDAQTAYALAITFGLFDDGADTAAAGARLADLVAAAGNRIATGFAGTPVIADALSSTGHLQTAYDLVLERECPSWLYTVRSGGTTIWERWDSLMPDGTVNPGGMTSFNHYALGAVADWLHRVVAGLSPEAPGYRQIRFAPRPAEGLTAASARHLTPYGPASIAWELRDGLLHVDLQLPPGTSGTLALPNGQQHRVPIGSSHYETADHDILPSENASAPAPARTPRLAVGATSRSNALSEEDR